MIPRRFDCSKVESRLLAFFTEIEVVWLLRCCGAALIKFDDVRICAFDIRRLRIERKRVDCRLLQVNLFNESGCGMGKAELLWQ
jgi:hypothetical protein